MWFDFRSWRAIAAYRGLPYLRNPRELRQALLLQMTPIEARRYRRCHCRLIVYMLALAALAWLVPFPQCWLVWYLIYVLYRLRYQHLDPIIVAMREYNRDLESVVKEDCATVRQQRIGAGL